MITDICFEDGYLWIVTRVPNDIYHELNVRNVYQISFDEDDDEDDYLGLYTIA